MKPNEIIAHTTHPWIDPDDQEIPWRVALRGSKVIIDALSAAGLVIVPREPSPEVTLHGARSIRDTMGKTNHTVRAMACWQAMIQRSLKRSGAWEDENE